MTNSRTLKRGVLLISGRSLGIIQMSDLLLLQHMIWFPTNADSG
jgi:hypothetical protein